MTTEVEIKRSTIALGTFIEIKCLVKAAELENVQSYISEVFAYITVLENRLSFFNPQSDLSKLNQSFSQSELIIGYELAVLLKIANYLNCKTDALFNVIMPHKVGEKMAEFLVQNQRRVKLLQEVKIDLGGIAKGFIVDKASKMIRDKVVGGIINAGGDIRIFGEYVAPIHIRDPFDHTQKIFLGNFSNCAIASSCISDNSKERGGKSAIYEKKEILHATVIGVSCAIADALTKVVLIDHVKSKEILYDLDYAAMAIDQLGNIINFE